MADGGRMLQVIFFAIFFGVVLLLIPEEHATPVKALPRRAAFDSRFISIVKKRVMLFLNRVIKSLIL